ncbi:hypothetical protein [Sinomicrobium sp. M5D2P9]
MIQKVLYQHYVNQEEVRLITFNKNSENEIDKDKYEEAILDTRKRLDVKLINGKCSQFIIEQIARHRMNIGEKYSGKIEFYNASEILDMIERLENNRSMYTDFTGLVLNGFSKIHHGAYSGLGYSLVRNIREFWFKKGVIRKERQEDFKRILLKHEVDGISAIAIAMQSYALNTRELKGEWIIFKQLDNKKYYLCLASHTEKDEIIYETKLKKCLMEYPELIYNRNSSCI